MDENGLVVTYPGYREAKIYFFTPQQIVTDVEAIWIYLEIELILLLQFH